MLANPVFHRELRSALRNGRLYLVACFYALALGGLAIQAWPSPSQALFGSRWGERIFEQFRVLQLALALGLAPALTWSAISAEREQHTWSTLRATPLQPPQIVFGKLACALVQLVLLILASLPVTCYCFFLGGVAPEEVRAAYASALGASVAAACVGLAGSAVMRRTYMALGLAYLLTGAMAAALWPFSAHGRTALVALVFYSIAVARSRSTSDREWERQVPTPPVDDSGGAASQPIDFPGNLVAARELATARRSQRMLVALAVAGSLALPGLLIVALFRSGLPFVRAVFPWYAAGQVALVNLAAASVGGYVIAVEQELRTMPLLLSTPLTASTVMRGKLQFALWHVALLTLMSVPVLTCAAFAQVIAVGEAFTLLATQLVFGFSFAIIGLFFSLRSRRTNRAVGMTLAFLFFISTLSVQVLALVPRLQTPRLGQLVMATNPLQTVWEREQPSPWERARARATTTPSRRRAPASAAPNPQTRAGQGPVPLTRESASALADLDDSPWISVLSASLVFYAGIAGLLWRLMLARFRAWSLPT